jgi:hypothetical protein
MFKKRYVYSQTYAGSSGILENPSPEEKKRRKGNLATHLRLAPKSRMHIALPPFCAERAQKENTTI